MSVGVGSLFAVAGSESCCLFTCFLLPMRELLLDDDGDATVVLEGLDSSMSLPLLSEKSAIEMGLKPATVELGEVVLRAVVVLRRKVIFSGFVILRGPSCSTRQRPRQPFGIRRDAAIAAAAPATYMHEC